MASLSSNSLPYWEKRLVVLLWWIMSQRVHCTGTSQTPRPQQQRHTVFYANLVLLPICGISFNRKDRGLWVNFSGSALPDILPLRVYVTPHFPIPPLCGAGFPEDLVKKVFITGITGQDGSYLAELLLAKGYEVHGIIRRASTFNTGRIDHLYQDPHINDVQLFLHYSDLTDSTSLMKLRYRIQPEIGRA